MSIGSSDSRNAFFRYLAWSDEDELWRIVCTDAGFCEIGPDSPYPPLKDDHPQAFKSVATGRMLNEYQLVYITKGRGVFETQGSRYEVVPGSVLLVFPGVHHIYRPEPETGWTEYWVGFKGDNIDALCRDGFLSSDRPFYQAGLRNGILAHYTQIFDLVRNQEPLYQPKAGALILGLIAEVLSCERKSTQSTQAESLVAQAKFQMEANIDADINLNGIAESLGVSTSHLSEAFKSYTAMTPYQYFISIKINRAKELLEHELPVKEVAWRLGFSDEYYFSRLFKNKTGISPSHWKPYSGQ
jgi:AraC-like DNA-binding protein